MSSIVNQFQSGLIWQLKYQLRSWFSLYPKLFFPIVNMRENSRQLAINKETQIVIEGFPRSGNSFAVGAFRSAQSQPINIATHLHAPAQIILACRKNIPTLVVIRNPIDAVVSLKALHMECNSQTQEAIESSCNFSILLKSYINFYRTIISHKDKFVVGKFEETTKDFSKIITKINHHFDTKFSEFEHTESNVQQVFNQQGFHAGPTLQRQELKRELKKEIKQEKYQSLISEAEEVYQQFLLLAK